MYSDLDVWLTEVLVLSGAPGIFANSMEPVPNGVRAANLILPVWRSHGLSLDLHTAFRERKMRALKVLTSRLTRVFVILNGVINFTSLLSAYLICTFGQFACIHVTINNM